jgi:hypothetical protein
VAWPPPPPLAILFLVQNTFFQLLNLLKKHHLGHVFKLWPSKKILLQSNPPKINFLVMSLLKEGVKF